MNGSGQQVNATIMLIVHSNTYTQRLRLAATVTHNLRHPIISLCCQCPLLLLWRARDLHCFCSTFSISRYPLSLPLLFPVFYNSLPRAYPTSGSFIETEKRIRVLSLRLCFRSPHYLQDAARLHADINLYCIISVHLTDILFPKGNCSINCTWTVFVTPDLPLLPVYWFCCKF